jgi:hypothetical protein
MYIHESITMFGSYVICDLCSTMLASTLHFMTYMYIYVSNGFKNACGHSTGCSGSNLNVSHSVSVAAATRASCASLLPPSSSAFPTARAVHHASPTEVTTWNPSLFSSHQFVLHYLFLFPFGSFHCLLSSAYIQIVLFFPFCLHGVVDLSVIRCIQVILTLIFPLLYKH